MIDKAQECGLTIAPYSHKAGLDPTSKSPTFVGVSETATGDPCKLHIRWECSVRFLLV